MRNLYRFDRDPDRRNARPAGRRAGPVAAPRQGHAPPPAQKGPPPQAAAEGPPPPAGSEGRAAAAGAATGSRAARALYGARRRAAEALRPIRALRRSARNSWRSRRRRIAPRSPSWCMAKDFFWLKEEGNAAGKKTGIEALATALSLAAKDGSGWETLGAFAADETAAPYPDRPNTVCSPAGPEFKSGGPGKARRDDQDRYRRLGLHGRAGHRGARQPRRRTRR